MLRDALLAAGLDVWYDEKELGGGDAWDAKIRRQIRECDYFMPVISATTEARKEGYFRREWRLATERTLDMADDVLFLLPVVIDETTESAARVPEKFFTVQWVRAPGGATTPALDAVAKRMLAGDHTPLPRARGGAHAMFGSRTAPPPGATTAPFTTPPMGQPPPIAPERDDAPPPMPPFPHPPEGGVGHWFKFLAEVIWWFVTAAWVLMGRFPRWVRIVVGIWVIITMISMCGKLTSTSSPPARQKSSERTNHSPNRSEIQQAVKAAADRVRAELEKSAKDIGAGVDAGKRRGKATFDPNAAGKPLVLVPFGRDVSGEEPEAVRFAAAVFVACSDKLLGSRPADVAVTNLTAPSGPDDGLLTVGRTLGAGHILGAKIQKTDAARTLVVRLIKSESGTVLWTGMFPIETGHASEVGAKIAEAVLEALPPAAPTPPPAPSLPPKKK